MTWQPIETAPKNRPIVLKGGYMWLDSKTKVPNTDAESAQWRSDGWFNYDSHIYSANTDEEHPCVKFEEPTHWMPLPEPPKTTMGTTTIKVESNELPPPPPPPPPEPSRRLDERYWKGRNKNNE